MKYISTRGGMNKSSFSDIVIGGLAPDGGLTLPEVYPKYSKKDLENIRNFTYQELAFEIINKFVDDIPDKELKKLINKTYTKDIFQSDEITPLTQLGDNFYLLGLSNGPTLAFKDVALQFLGNLFEYLLEKNNDYLNVLGGTSGDTGSSAEEALRGKKNVTCFMLSPYQKMSPFQAAQMYSIKEQNIYNIALKGVFDDCQDLVKAVNNDKKFKEEFHIGAVNSINWARVAAQIVYYFKGYFAATDNSSQEVDFSVPTGNFGDILAGHIAKQMGLPIRRLILATNENSVLDEFFKKGIYRKRKDVIKTSSPSMDISKASNFERFLYDLFDRNPQLTKSYMEQFEKEGQFDLKSTPYFKKMSKFGFVSGSSTHKDRLETIRKIKKQFGIIVDTHTADGIKVGLEYQEKNVPLICLETAKATKFEETIQEALGYTPKRLPKYENIEKKPQRVIIMEKDVDGLKDYIRKNAIKK